MMGLENGWLAVAGDLTFIGKAGLDCILNSGFSLTLEMRQNSTLFSTGTR